MTTEKRGGSRPGSGRKPSAEKTTTIAFRVPVALAEKIKESVNQQLNQHKMNMITNFTATPSGYGHYKTSIQLAGETYTLTTDDMRTMDNYNHDEQDVSDEAKLRLIRAICKAYELGEASAEVNQFGEIVYRIN